MAAVERWVARIWPGIPLGGIAALGGSAEGAGDLLRPATAVIARLLSLVPSIAQAAGDSPAASPSAAASDPKLTLSNASARRKTIYLVALIALLALLAFTIWKEMWPALRTSLR